ncbi:MAG: carboxypeptidase-like regulatory domain-containing protein [Terriglobia bacterium]
MSKSKLFWLLILLGCLPGAAYAQSTFASITGTVTDSSGAVVPSAKITATNLGTNIQSTVQSNASGIYTVGQLNPGTYSLQVRATGFNQYLVSDIILNARDVRRIDVKLTLGKVTTQVTVTGGATLINTENARINQTQLSYQLNQLPLNSGAMWGFLALAPGVVQQPGQSTIRISGSRGGQDNWSVDGTTFSDGVDNTQIGPVANYTESFQSIQTSLANNSAQFGALGQITAVSKSGTNQLHGDAWDRYSSTAFDARSPFEASLPSFVSHNVAGSLGGPLYIPHIYNGRDKTFFFISWEGYLGSASTGAYVSTVPTQAFRNGDFSSLLPGVQIYDPTTGLPFAGNTIPQNRLNSVSQKLQQLYPLPNFGNTSVLQANNFQELYSFTHLTDYLWNARLDEKISDKDSFYARIAQQHNPANFPQALPTLGPWTETRRDDDDTLSYTHIFSPSVLNEFRVGYVFNNEPLFTSINGSQYVNGLGLQGLAPGIPTNIPGLPKVTLTGTGITSTGVTENYSNPGYLNRTYQFQDSVNWSHGRHFMKFGTEIGKVDWEDLSASPNLFGSLTFAPTYTSGGITGQGYAYADFLLGIPTSSSIAPPPIEQLAYRWFYNFYGEDQFKITRRLTLNMGLRYQLTPSWSEQHHYLADFDPAIGKIVVPNGALNEVSPLMPTSYVQTVGASSAGLPQNLIYTAKHDFAPRIGLAYMPWGAHTVFRAGFGVFYNAVPYPYLSLGDTVPFVVQPPTYTNSLSSPIVLPEVFPSTGTGGPSSVSLPAAMNPHLPIPYSEQWNVTIEHQQWNTGFRISYVGTASRQDTFSYDINSPIPNAVPYVDKPRPFPNYPNIYYNTNGAFHQYNGLTLEAQRQMKGGVFFQASYTWERDITNYDWDGNYATPEDPFNFQRDIGPAQGEVSDRFTSALIYVLPFGQGRRWASNASGLVNQVVAGWHISAIFSAQTGQFLTPEWCGADPVGTTYTTGAPAQVCIRPDVNGNPNSGGQGTIGQWFDTGVYSPPQPGQFGTAGPGSIIGPGLAVLDAGIMKEFYLHGEKGPKLQLQLTATNALNHVNWSNPDVYVSDGPSFGTISGVGGVNGGSTGDVPGPRALQAMLRIAW